MVLACPGREFAPRGPGLASSLASTTISLFQGLAEEGRPPGPVDAESPRWILQTVLGRPRVRLGDKCRSREFDHGEVRCFVPPEVVSTRQNEHCTLRASNVCLGGAEHFRTRRARDPVDSNLNGACLAYHRISPQSRLLAHMLAMSIPQARPPIHGNWGDQDARQHRDRDRDAQLLTSLETARFTQDGHRSFGCLLALTNPVREDPPTPRRTAISGYGSQIGANLWGGPDLNW